MRSGWHVLGDHARNRVPVESCGAVFTLSTVPLSTRAGRTCNHAGQMPSSHRYNRTGQLLRLALDMAGTREGLSVMDVRERIGVSHRTAERLMAALREVFPAIEAVPGEGRSLRWRLPQGHAAPLASATAIQLAELGAATERLRREGAPAERVAALEDLGRHVRLVIRQDVRRRISTDAEALMEAEGMAVRPGPKPALIDGLFSTIRKAILSCHELDVTYARSGKEPVVHRLKPLGVLYGARPYLVGSVAGTPGDPTMFRLDRVLSAGVRTESFTHEDFDLKAWAAKSFGVFQGDEPDAVILRFSAEVADDARRWHFHGTQTMTDLPGGQLLVRFTACGRREMIHHLATWGEHVEVLEPADLRRELAAWARSVSTHHRRIPQAEDAVQAGHMIEARVS